MALLAVLAVSLDIYLIVQILKLEPEVGREKLFAKFVSPLIPRKNTNLYFLEPLQSDVFFQSRLKDVLERYSRLKFEYSCSQFRIVNVDVGFALFSVEFCGDDVNKDICIAALSRLLYDRILFFYGFQTPIRAFADKNVTNASILILTFYFATTNAGAQQMLDCFKRDADAYKSDFHNAPVDEDLKRELEKNDIL